VPGGTNSVGAPGGLAHPAPRWWRRCRAGAAASWDRCEPPRPLARGARSAC